MNKLKDKILKEFVEQFGYVDHNLNDKNIDNLDIDACAVYAFLSEAIDECNTLVPIDEGEVHDLFIDISQSEYGDAQDTYKISHHDDRDILVKAICSTFGKNTKAEVVDWDALWVKFSYFMALKKSIRENETTNKLFYEFFDYLKENQSKWLITGGDK